MRAQRLARFSVAIAIVVTCFVARELSAEPGGKKAPRVQEGAYYEFRGHIYDRSTIDRTFTLYWSEGSQPIFVSGDTKVYRHGRLARLEDVKSGDAVRGVGQVRKGRLFALAVAFGDEGVELPSSANVPHAIGLPPTKPQ